MSPILKLAVAAATLTMAGQAMAQITFYENDGWRGRAFTTESPVANFSAYGFNDRASSVVVDHGRWEVCEDAGFRGRCVVLRRGSYESLRGLGLNDRISSARPVGDHARVQAEAPPPLPEPTYEYRRRPHEDVYEAQVMSVHAVVGSPEQRCWVDREQVRDSGHNNAGGAVVGAILGGVLGHQIGGGTGRDVATAGGAVAGAVIGSNSGGGGTSERDVRRCENVPSTTPAYWDVTYRYNGIDHRIQMSSAPGNTVPVNRNGEPRM